MLSTARRSPWLVWAAGLAAMALTARLGWWQLDRAAQKVALESAQSQRALAPALQPAELPRDAAEAAANEHRRAIVHGRWLAEHTVFLDNRPLAGRAGFFVLTPLGLDDGRVLLVQRGWWPRDAVDRTRIAAPPPPSGRVVVLGRVALAVSRQYELGADAGGPIRQNLDLQAFTREAKLKLLPWLLVQLDDAAGAPVGDGLDRHWPAPASDVGKHYGYAAQWFALSALVLVLLLWFRVVRPRRQSATAADPART